MEKVNELAAVDASKTIQSIRERDGIRTLLITLLWGLVLNCGLVVAATPAQEATSSKSFTVVRTSVRPVIDGKVDEAVWQQAAVIDDLTQIRPGDRTPPSERTEIYVMYDQDNLYIGARMWDSEPNKISRSVMKQGSPLRDDDRLAIVIDPFNTGRQGYRFEVNLNGVRNEGLYQNNQIQSEWEVIWEAAGAENETGWTAEMAIPFKSLPFDPKIESWGFNASRAIRRRGEEAVWVSRNRTFNPSIVGVAHGLHDLDQGVGLDIVPGLSVIQRKSYVDGSSSVTSEPSLNAYYRVTPALSASLTINTDFSTTEVDDRQVNLTRFSLFFPEKRDFFLNDADLFEFGRIGIAGFLTNERSVSRASQENARPFFSRRIGLSALGTPVDLKYGSKLTGRIGDFNIGTLAVRQGEFIEPSGKRIDASNLLAARVAMNVLTESSIGVIATSGNPTSNLNNTLVGADFLYLNTRLSGGRSLEGEVWYQKSATEGITGDDSAYGVQLRAPNSAGWRGNAGLREIGKNFLPGLGFTSRTGVRDINADLGYTRVFGGTLQSVFTGVDMQRVTSLDDGRLQSQQIALRPVELEMRGRDVLRMVYTTNREQLRLPFTIYQSGGRSVVITPGNYNFDDFGFDLATGTQRTYAATINFRRGQFYEGERTNMGGEFAWKQSRFFTLRIAHDWNRVNLPQGNFITRLTRATSEVSFSSRLGWITLLQYDDVSEIFGIHSRLVWIPKAGQEYFLVLNRNFQDTDKDNTFQSVRSDLTAKVSYTFRY